MTNNKKSWLRGFGVGIMIASMAFYLLLLFTGYNDPEKNYESYTMSQEEIESRARDLGMFYLSDMIDKTDAPVEGEESQE